MTGNLSSQPSPPSPRRRAEPCNDWPTSTTRSTTTTSTNAKVEALAAYFRQTPPAGCRLGAVLPHRPTPQAAASPRRPSGSGSAGADGHPGVALRRDVRHRWATWRRSSPCCWIRRSAPPPAEERPLSHWMEERILPLAGLSLPEQRERVIGWWHALPRRELFLSTRCSPASCAWASPTRWWCARSRRYADLPPASVSHRLMGTWAPTRAFFEQLVAPDVSDGDALAPLPLLPGGPAGAARGGRSASGTPGSSNGSGTASAASSSAARAASTSGAAARS